MQTLRTERRLLLFLREEACEESAEMVADAEVMRYLGEGKPLSRGDAWRQMAFVLGHWQLRGYGLLGGGGGGAGVRGAEQEENPLARGGAWREMAFALGHWQLRGYGLWAVEEVATGRLVDRPK